MHSGGLKLKFQKGFTLIELMVVISIIGVLSSVVIVSINDARVKAQIAKSSSFSQQVRHALDIEAIAVYDFHDSTANDSSNFGNNGVFSGSYAIVDSVVNKGVQFNGGSVYINSITQTPSAMTFVGWFKKTTSTWDSIAFLGKRNASTGWMLYRNSGDTAGYFRWYSFYVNTADAIVGYRTWPGISGLAVNRWYFFTVTRDAIGNTRIYVDGVRVYSGAPPADFKSWNDNANGISIGSDRAGSTSYINTGSIIDEVAIYQDVLSVSQIGQLYAKGSQSHPVAKK